MRNKGSKLNLLRLSSASLLLLILSACAAAEERKLFIQDSVQISGVIVGEPFSYDLSALFTVELPELSAIELVLEEGANPAWVLVDANHALSGTPGLDHLGQNIYRYTVTNASDIESSLQIEIEVIEANASDILSTDEVPYGPALSNRSLIKRGTSGDDVIRISELDADHYLVQLNDQHEKYLKEDISQINFTGRNGNDTLINDTHIHSHLQGGQGNDTLYGGSGWDVLLASDGDDILYGREGDDYLYGGLEMYGGPGTDYFATEHLDTVTDAEPGETVTDLTLF